MRLVAKARVIMAAALTWGALLAPAHAQDAAAADPAAATASAVDARPLGTEAPAAAKVVAPASSVPAPAPHVVARPAYVPMSAVNSGDTAWMISASALVLMMTIPGLALFYAGMVRKKNILATMAQSIAICALVSCLWFAAGYSLAFMPGSPWIGSLAAAGLKSLHYDRIGGLVSVHHLAPTIPESVFVMFQLTFAIVTPALITGAFAERMRFSALLFFIAAWSLLVYAPVAHWVWEPTGWLAALGVLDFAGGTVVHVNAGISGLVAAWMLGPRLGFRKEPFMPANLGLTLIGAALLWVGWMGFNGGSAGAADGRAGMAMLVTQLAAGAAVLSWMMCEWVIRGTPTLLGLCSGAVSGLVAITPASGFVDAPSALLIGLAAGAGCYWGATALKRMLRADDSLDVFGVHGIGGVIGALLTGVFADRAIGGAPGSVLTQAIGVGATLLYSGVVTAGLLWIVDKAIGLRVGAAEENVGLDLSLHGERVE